MKEIPLTRGKVALVDDEDYELLNQWKWYAVKSHNCWYAQRTIYQGVNNSYIKMHRLILNTPEGMQSDHINGNGLDNRRENLRVCTNTENCRNQKPQKHSSIFKGVTLYKSRNKWVARIKVSRSSINLGIFNSELEAAQAYDKAAEKYFGEFARTNL